MGRWYSSTPINLHLSGNPSNRVLYSPISITSSNSTIGSGFSSFSEDETDFHRSKLRIPQIFNNGNDLLWAREKKFPGLIGRLPIKPGKIENGTIFAVYSPSILSGPACQALQADSRISLTPYSAFQSKSTRIRVVSPIS